MLLIDSTAKTLEVVLAAGVVTQLPIVVDWVDIANGAQTSITDTTTTTNNTTAVTVVPASTAGTTRQVKFLSVRNGNSAAVIVKLQLNDNGTPRIIVAVSLAQDETLLYIDGLGVQVLNWNGEQKESQLLINLTTQVTGVLPVANGGTGDATLAAHGVLIGNGTSAVAATAVGTTGQVLTGVTGADPTWQAPTAGTVDNSVVDFRLTLTTAVPETTTDVTGATTIYCSPRKGNRIALYDGAAWNIRTSAEFSLGLGTLTSGLPYDVFCYDNSGTPTLEFLAWTNGTTRATALVTQDGVLSKSGATTRRYLGTFVTTATTTTEDSVLKRYLWNAYNQVSRELRRQETNSVYPYTTATWRQANGSASNQVGCVVGVAGALLTLAISTALANTSQAVPGAVGVGEDSTTTPLDTGVGGFADSAAANANVFSQIQYALTRYPAVGLHFYAWLEYSNATGTMSWLGAGGVAGNTHASGLVGSIFG